MLSSFQNSISLFAPDIIILSTSVAAEVWIVPPVIVMPVIVPAVKIKAVIAPVVPSMAIVVMCLYFWPVIHSVKF